MDYVPNLLYPNQVLTRTGKDALVYLEPAVFGQKLIKLRKARKWTTKTFAKEINWALHCVQDWEKGAEVPRAEVARQLARLFNVSVEYLVDPEMNEYVPEGKTEQLDLFAI